MSRRWVELVAFYVGLPLVLGLLLPPSALYPVLLGATFIGIGLIWITPGVGWRDLIRWDVHWGQFFIFGLAVFGLALALCWWLLPDRILFLPREAPEFLPVLAIGYTLVLVIPQELLYRVLFFHRYGALFPNRSVMLVANAVLFALGHLMYWHWVVMTLTFAGSFVFAKAYQKRSFAHAVLLHAIAGFVIFASGLGWLFFSGGNIAQNP